VHYQIVWTAFNRREFEASVTIREFIPLIFVLEDLNRSPPDRLARVRVDDTAKKRSRHYGSILWRRNGAGSKNNRAAVFHSYKAYSETSLNSTAD
jgi:hypothetical protein